MLNIITRITIDYIDNGFVHIEANKYNYLLCDLHKNKDLLKKLIVLMKN